MPEEYFTDDWHDPRAMHENGERQLSDEEFLEQYIVGPDPDQHAERIREVEKLGATVVCLQNASGADPVRALEIYGEQVLPSLRGVRGLIRFGNERDRTYCLLRLFHRDSLARWFTSSHRGDDFRPLHGRLTDLSRSIRRRSSCL